MQPSFIFNDQDLQKQMDDLAKQLLEYQRLYYQEGKSLISDQEYDKLNDQLLRLEKDRPDLKRIWSPTTRVGSDLTSDFPEIKHKIPVLSLDKVYQAEDLYQWLDKNKKNTSRPLVVTLEQKMDGISIVLYYKNGELDKAVTRGNGSVGNDVTNNIKTIHQVPLKVNLTEDFAVRGEVYLPLSQFDQINSFMDEPYANPRNLTAGTLRRIKTSDVAQIPLSIFCYEVFFDSESPNKNLPQGHLESLAMIKSLGFPVSQHLDVFSPTGELNPQQQKAAEILGLVSKPFEDLKSQIELETAQRNHLDWEIDGLVLKVDDLNLREELGYTDHHPRWAMAYKFESPQGITTLEKIFVQVGRTGRITPVAKVKPVGVGGSTITFVTLHNESFVQAMELGEGDIVSISRRGDVIPAVEQVVEKLASQVWKFPTQCPSCGTDLVADGAHHFCPNVLCPEQRKARLSFFAGKGQMDLESMGPETVEVLYRLSMVQSPEDFFTCDYDKLKEIEGFGEKKIQLIKQGIEKARNRSYETLLVSLGIPDLGKKMAELIIDNGYKSFDDLKEVLEKSPEKLLEITGIGEKTIQNLKKEVLSPQILSLVRALEQCGLSLESKEIKTTLNKTLEGTIWCVTGSFTRFQPRSLAEAEIVKRSGKVVSAVSGKTTHLLAGQNAGSKLENAKKLGIQIITEKDFVVLIS